MHDIKEIDPNLYKGFEHISSYEGDDLEEMLGLTF